MKLLPSALLLLCLAACDDIPTTHAKCRVDFLNNRRLSDSDETYSNYVDACMQAHHHHLDQNAPGCTWQGTDPKTLSPAGLNALRFDHHCWTSNDPPLLKQ